MNNLPTWPHQPKEHDTIRLLALWVLLEGSEQAVSKSPRIGEDSAQAEGGQLTGWPPAPAPCLPYSINGNHRAGAFLELRTLLKKEIDDCAKPQETRRVAEILELMDWDSEARTWWQKAAAKGDEDARDYLEILDAEQEEELSACPKEQRREAYVTGIIASLVSDGDFACRYIDRRAAANRVESALAEAGLGLSDGARALIREIEDFLAHLDPTTGGPRC
ncbi:hypothetical protein [Streptomyces sp. NPDC058739]|uniref:hypothetical protein n=1 Tax=Streptomyces sp. NPDC058739 TaxID=3346618 RepID=UPI0036C9C8E9